MASSDDGWEDVPITVGSNDGWEDVPITVDQAPKRQMGTIDTWAEHGKNALEDTGRTALEGFGKVARAVDSVTGAPLRAAGASYQRGDDMGDVVKAGWDQFGADPAKAPSGKDLMAKAGLSTEENYRLPLIMDPWAKGNDKYAHVSPAGVAGGVADAVLDPTSYVGVGLAGRGAKAAVGGAAKLDAKVASYLTRMAEERAAKAATGQNIAALRRMGKVTAAGSKDAERVMGRVRQTGRQLLDEGVVSFGDSVENIAPKATEALKKAGGDIGAVGTQIDAAMPKGSVSGKTIADDIVNYASTIPETEGGKALQERLLAEAASIESMGDMTFAKAQDVKNQFKFKAQDQDRLVSNADTVNKINSIIGDQMEQTAVKAGLGDAYTGAKQRYGVMSDAATGANDRVLKNLSNRTPSPSDYGVGAAAGTMAAAITRDPMVTAGVSALAGGANRILRQRGSSSVAAIADAVSKLMAKNPERFAKWSPVLETAAQTGAAALAVKHHVLMNNDPQYRQAILGATP